MNQNIKSYRISKPSTWAMTALLTMGLWFATFKPAAANDTEASPKTTKTSTAELKSASSHEVGKQLLFGLEMSVIAAFIIFTAVQHSKTQRSLVVEPVAKREKGQGLNIDYKKTLDDLFGDLQKTMTDHSGDRKKLETEIRKVFENTMTKLDKSNSMGLKKFSDELKKMLLNQDLSKMTAADFELYMMSMKHDFGVFKTESKSKIFFFRLLAEILLPLAGIISTQIALVDIFSSDSRDLVRVSKSLIPPITGFTSSALFQYKFGRKMYAHVEEAKQRLQYIMEMFVLVSKKTYEMTRDSKETSRGK